jgi:sulfide:quinone oxidoreductase
MPSRNDKLHVLVAGGGVAALEAMVALRKLAGELVDVELVSPDADFHYRPLAVAEPFGLGEALRFDLASLARGCGARHSLGTLVAVRADERRIWRAETPRTPTTSSSSPLAPALVRPSRGR